MVEVGSPRSMIQAIRNHGKNCERLGCATKVFKYVKHPESGDILAVCPPCAWARSMWDELNREGESNAHKFLKEELH